jgi:hypothetical protein
MKICLIQYNPFYPKIGILDSYNEVVDSIHWGLVQMGCQVERLFNNFDADALNIVFGFQIPLQLGIIDNFPSNTIFYNFERYADKNVTNTGAEHVAKNFQIWDYSLSNIEVWKKLNPKFIPYHAYISYSNNLEKISTNEIKDIDVLYYGNITPDRTESLQKISKLKNDLTGLSVVTLCNVWGEQRDHFIARSKVVVNFSRGNIFEVVRVSYLLANKVAVVSDFNESLAIESDLKECLFFAKPEEIMTVCELLVENEPARLSYANKCYEVFKLRNVIGMLRNFSNFGC